jgi:hypothetical protein
VIDIKKGCQFVSAVIFAPVIVAVMLKTFLRMRKDLSIPNREMYE